MLSEELPDATILQGDGTDKEFLLEEGLAHTESLVALTNMDEENLMLALLARKYSEAKLVAKVNRIHFEEVIDDLDIDSIIYPKNLAAEHLCQRPCGDGEIPDASGITYGRTESGRHSFQDEV